MQHNLKDCESRRPRKKRKTNRLCDGHKANNYYFQNGGVALEKLVDAFTSESHNTHLYLPTAHLRMIDDDESSLLSLPPPSRLLPLSSKEFGSIHVRNVQCQIMFQDAGCHHLQGRQHEFSIPLDIKILKFFRYHRSSHHHETPQKGDRMVFLVRIVDPNATFKPQTHVVCNGISFVLRTVFCVEYCYAVTRGRHECNWVLTCPQNYQSVNNTWNITWKLEIDDILSWFRNEHDNSLFDLYYLAHFQLPPVLLSIIQFYLLS